MLLSGGRDSVCLLDVAVRSPAPARSRALHVNYGLRDEAGADEAHCRALCERLGVALHVEPAAAGRRRRATSRPGRATCATPGRASRSTAAATSPPGHTATDQVETVLYRLAASPGRRALLGMARARGPARAPAARASTREETAAHCARARPGLARGRQQRRARVRAQPRAPGAVPALRALHPAAEANVLRTLELLRDEAAVLDAVVDDGARRGRRPAAARSAARLPPALRAARVQRLADAAAGGRAPAIGHRAGRAARRSPRAARSTSAAALRAEVRGRRAARSVRSRGPRGAAPPTLRVPRMRALTMLRDPGIGEILVQADDLQHRVRQLGEEISRDYAGKDLLLIGVLKGAVFFLADLMREIDVPCEVDFMAVASYGSATESSGVVRILKDLDTPIEGRDVLIVEDIVDSGLTLQYLLRTLEARGPASLEVCALLTKPERRNVDLPTRYIGFEIPDKFAIGYGLDHAERYRNLPYVAALSIA